tara:strand:+ start:92 stop:493 length:402 start_codon:yes stop_codon:yes gene_type:complete
MARVISTNGRKKISTLKKEFKEKFPHLEFKVYRLEDRGNFERGKDVLYVNDDLTLSEVRTKKGNGEISFSGNKNVGTIETEFFDKLGMYVEIQFLYEDGCGSKSSAGGTDDLTLSEYNIYAQKMIAKRREEKN